MRGFLLLIALAAAAAGCAGGLIRPKVEKGIRESLPGYIGPAREYRVRADGSTSAMMNGLIGHLHIEGTDVEIDPRLTAARLIVDMDEIRFNPRTKEMKNVGNTVFQVTIDQKSVNSYISEARADEADLQVKINPGEIAVQFVPRYAGISVLVTVNGRLAVAGGDKVDFVADKASVAHLPVPASVVNAALKRLNPILDLSEMRFPVTLDDIAIKENAVIISGRAAFNPAAHR